MYVITSFTLFVFLIFGCASEESSESSESSEFDSEEFKKFFCDDENGTISNAMDKCFEEMNLPRFENIMKECYTGIQEASGKGIYDWYCSNSDDEMDKADECAEEKIKDQEGEIIIELLKNDILNCTEYNGGFDEVEMEYEDED